MVLFAYIKFARPAQGIFLPHLGGTLFVIHCVLSYSVITTHRQEGICGAVQQRASDSGGE
jgi:hypothetical protein